MVLSQRVQNLKPSPTLALAALAQDMKNQGLDIISLSVGEPDWDTFDFIKEAGIKAIREGKTKYTPAAGNHDLRVEIASLTQRHTGIEYTPSQQITVSTGAKFVLFSCLQCIVNPGDEVIVVAPYWVSYPEMVELAQGRPRIVECREDQSFKLTASALNAAITPKTKAIILNSPNNPTGGVYSPKEWHNISEVLRKNTDVIIIVDDIYNRLVFDYPQTAPHLLSVAPDLASRTVVVNGVSKSYSMTGWRLGWAAGPSEIIRAMTNYQSQTVSCASSISQSAALTALKSGESEVQLACEELKRRKEFVYGQLYELFGERVFNPGGAFFIWLDVRPFLGKSFEQKKLNSCSEFSMALLQSQMVVTVPGADFGLAGYLRLSFALNLKRMTEAVQRLHHFVKQLN